MLHSFYIDKTKFIVEYFTKAGDATYFFLLVLLLILHTLGKKNQ